MAKKIISMILAVCLCMGMGLQAFAVAKIGETEYEDFTLAVEDANNAEESVEIQLTDNVTLDSKVTIKNDIVISNSDDGEFTITRADTYTGTLFEVEAENTLTLDGVTVDGGNEWTFDWESFIEDVKAGKTVDGNSTHYHELKEGDPVATEPVFNISGSVVMENGATVQNNAGSTVFNVKNGGSLETNEANITHNYKGGVETVATVANGGSWTINEGTVISDNFSRSGNGGLCRVYGEVIINDGLFTNNAAIGNGSIFMVYKGGSYLEMNDGLFTENYCLNNNGNNWNGVIHVHYDGGTTFVMNDGEISENYGSYCGGLSASKGGTPASITINGGKIVNNGSAINGKDVTLGQNITINGDSTFGEVKAYRDVTVTEGSTMTVLDTLYLWKNGLDIAFNGEGTVDGNVYIYNGAKVTMNGGSWINGMVTVNAIGTNSALLVEPAATINGVQVRVLNSVASGDYTNPEEAAAAQASSYVKEEGAEVESPVLFYHRLASNQKKDVVVTFDYNGGVDAQGWSGCQVTGEKGEEGFVPESPAPEREGYVFVGWKYAEVNSPETLDMNGEIDFEGEGIDSSLRLVAQWEEVEPEDSEDPEDPEDSEDPEDPEDSEPDDEDDNYYYDDDDENTMVWVDYEEDDEEVVVIDDEPTPLSDAPAAPEEQYEVPSDTETIIDEEVPLAEVPGLGDESAIWMLVVAFAIFGLVVINLPKRKLEDD